MINSKYLIPEWQTASTKAIRDGVGEGLLKLGGNHEDVVVLSANLTESTRVHKFSEEYPERFFDVGVAEQNMIGVASGLANSGFVPYTTSFASFSPGRSWEQIRVSVCMSSENVKIVGSHAGISVGGNGPSHMGTEDIAMMRVLPNMVVLAPADANQAAAMIEASYAHPGPVYIRVTRPETANFTKVVPYQIGKAEVYREGDDITICACGIQVYDALVVAGELAKQGIECEVINVSSIKPLDELTLGISARKTGKIMTIEDHQVSGGMGSAIAEAMSQSNPVPIRRVGIDDKFGWSGPWEEGYKKMGLDRASLKKAVVDWLHE